MDSTEFSINEPTLSSTNWYSHKMKAASVRYEVSISISGAIVWVNIPWPSGTNPDVRIFRPDMKQALLAIERFIADKGYSD